ncbi:MAG: hypothetical protein LJE69_06535 [Thiohalocapsa sp.]|uniref:hypothetical protein n=1 Tax=Thiohalocapsa sp. TaxID=2497641 RepID=UPI0025D2DA3D|nr:hypothetical protein [Thiohalocapsa sp.]MCG6940889.1 hypothetical protein [Thiohalocapsa sp.]
MNDPKAQVPPEHPGGKVTNDSDADTTGAPRQFTRREALKLSGLGLGGLAVGGAIASLTADITAADDLAPRTCTPDQDCCAGDSQCDLGCCPESSLGCHWTSTAKAQRYSYYDRLRKFQPFKAGALPTQPTVQTLDKNAMRITLMGTAVPPRNLAQRMMSVFVEVGWNEDTQLPLDSFVFDCGTGSSGSYNSMNVSFRRMNKVFLTHLHADHMSDLTHIYCFGAAADRKTPLWVWGPGPSKVPNPNYQPGGSAPEYYDDGTAAFCSHLRDACRWHSESMSFLSTAYVPASGTVPACEDPDNFGFATDPDDTTRVQRPAQPAGQYADDDPSDGYALFPVDIPFDFGSDWTEGSSPEIIVYQNALTGVTITAYPVIHCRQGAVAYKLQYRNPDPLVTGAPTLSMIFTGDTKPERFTVEQANNNGEGIDVLIHEMGVPPEVWAMKMARLDFPSLVPDADVCEVKKIQNSSHTPQGAFGYLLSQISPFPGLTVATHFPSADDTVQCAMKSLKEHLPTVYQGERPNPPSNAPRVTFAFDLMVLDVSVDDNGKRRIVERRGDIDLFGYQATLIDPPEDEQLTPKYHCPDASGANAGDPLLQINSTTTLWPCDEDGNCRYRDDGY